MCVGPGVWDAELAALLRMLGDGLADVLKRP